MSKKTYFLFLFIFINWQLQAQDIYVSPLGTDTNDGSQASPVASISRALELVAPGNTIFVQGDGTANIYTYEEAATLNINQPLTLSGLGQAVRVVTNRNADVLLDIFASDVAIEGLILDGLNTVTNEAAKNIVRVSPGNVNLSNISITQNEIVNAAAIGIAIGQGVGTAEVNALLIDGNTISNNDVGISLTQTLNNAQISSNDISDNASFGLVNNSGSGVSAEFNWWGGVTPSSVVGEVSDLVQTVYSPWLTRAVDIDPGTEGFQASLLDLGAQRTNNNTDALVDAYNALLPGGTIRLFAPVTGLNRTYEPIVANKDLEISSLSNSRLTLNEISTTNNATLSLTGEFETNSINLQSGSLIVTNSPLLLTDVAGFDASAGTYQGAIFNEPATVAAGEPFAFLGASISAGPEPLTGLTLTRINNETVTFGNNRSIEVIWDIDIAQENFSPRTLTFSWDDSFDGVNNFEDGNDAFVWKSNNEGQSWDFYASVQAQSASGIRSLSVSDVTDFSQWTVSDVNNPLPVELTSFEASLLEPHVELQWETAAEENADFFAIERSENGQDFQQVGSISATGDSDVPQGYRFIDEQAALRFGGSLFYRLRTVDFDGSYEYSDIVNVIISDEGIPLISAFAQQGQPEVTLFTRSVEAGTYQVFITDMNGRKVYEQEVELGNQRAYTINVGTLSQAVYTIRCAGGQMILASKFRVE